MSAVIERWTAAERAVEIPPHVREANIVMLGEAHLCVDCEAITGATLGVCDRCGSASLLNLGDLLCGRCQKRRAC